MRSGLAPDLQIAGTVSGKIAYDATAPAKPAKTSRSKHSRPAEVVTGPLTGSLTVEGLTLSGGGLSQPIQVTKIVLEPVLSQSPNLRLALAGSTAVPLGGTAPVTVGLSLSIAGYSAQLRGQASMARARELTRAAGLAQAPALDGLAGDPLDVDLTAAGPWLVQQKSPPAAKTATPETQAAEPAAKAAVPAAKTAPAAKVENAPASIPVEDSLTGTVSLRNANWRADFLAGHVEIAQATLNLSPGEIRWDPVDFSYGRSKVRPRSS